MTRQKKRNVSRGSRPSARPRQLPWPILAGTVVLVVAGFLIARSLEIGAPGERIGTGGVGEHVTEGQPIQYPTLPPVGGPHWPAPAPWGVSAVPIPDERAVHNLEHGGVVVSYNAIADEDLRQLQSLTLTYPKDKYGEVKVVVRPYDRIAAGTFVLTAWGWREAFSRFDAPTLKAFLDAHLNRCCEAVP